MDNRSGAARGFTPMLAPGLSEEARKAVAAAFDAMSAWRNDLMIAGEKGGDRALDKMAAAAKALGWPAEIVDTTRAQMQGITRMQVQMMDQLMDAWEEQLKSQKPMGAFPAEMMSRLQSLPGMMPGAGFPGMEAFPGMMANPMQFWMEMGQQWQKNWAQAMSFWSANGSWPGGRR